MQIRYFGQFRANEQFKRVVVIVRRRNGEAEGDLRRYGQFHSDQGPYDAL